MYTNKKKCKKSLACFEKHARATMHAVHVARRGLLTTYCHARCPYEKTLVSQRMRLLILLLQPKKKKKKTITRNLNEVNTSQKRREHSQGISKRYETITIQTRNN